MLKQAPLLRPSGRSIRQCSAFEGADAPAHYVGQQKHPQPFLCKDPTSTVSTTERAYWVTPEYPLEERLALVNHLLKGNNIKAAVVINTFYFIRNA